MTIQALAWAIDQQIPGPSKLVLVSLANHADHTNGYCHLDLSTISRESSVPTRSLWRYFGALERNGYLVKDERSKSKDAERRDYWLILDRDVGLPWAWDAPSGDAEAGESDGAAEPVQTVPASSEGPSGFSRARQREARGAAEAASTAQGAAQVPIIEGTEAFKVWCDYCRNVLLTVPPFVHAIVLANGKSARGFYRPSLFPPRGQIDDIEGVA